MNPESDTAFDIVAADEVTSKISSKQKGTITENRISEIVTLSSGGSLTCYTPDSDDDGIDLIVNPKSEFKPLFLQIKSRFVLQKSGQFIQNVGHNTFNEHKLFYLLFVYFNQNSLEVEKLWLIPSLAFKTLAYNKKPGENYKAFYRFAANPSNKSDDKWSKFSVEKTMLGDALLDVISALYQ